VAADVLVFFSSRFKKKSSTTIVKVLMNHVSEEEMWSLPLHTGCEAGR